jgi:hypothetical protein
MQNDLMDTPEEEPTTPYERFGGHEFFTALVHDFYVGVAQDPVLRPMYPDEDLAPPRTPMSGGTRGCACVTPPTSSAWTHTTDGSSI